MKTAEILVVLEPLVSMDTGHTGCGLEEPVSSFREGRETLYQGVLRRFLGA